MSRGVLYMALAVFFFSLMNLSVRKLEAFPVFELVFFRSLIASFLAWASLRYAGVSPWGINRGLLILRGMIGFAGLWTFFYTLQRMPFATAITVQYLSPIFIAVWGIFLLKEPVRWVQWLFFGISFAGVVLIKGLDDRVSLLLLGVGIFSAMCSGLAYTTVRMLRKTDHPLVVTFFFPLVTLPLAGIMTVVDWKQPLGWDWIWIVATGITAQLGQSFMTQSLHLEKASIAGSVQYIGVIFALAYETLIFGVAVPWFTWIGIALVVTGVVLNLATRKDT